MSGPVSPLVRRPLVFVVAADQIVRHGIVEVLDADARVRQWRPRLGSGADLEAVRSALRAAAGGVVVVDHPLVGGDTDRLLEHVGQCGSSWSVVVLVVDDHTEVARAAGRSGARVLPKRPGARGLAGQVAALLGGGAAPGGTTDGPTT